MMLQAKHDSIVSSIIFSPIIFFAHDHLSRLAAALRQSVKFAHANETQVLAQTYLTEARRMRALLLQSQEQLQQQIASCQARVCARAKARH